MNTISFLKKLGIKPKNSSISFGQGNAKLDKRIATFSLPSGYSCPGAKDCLAFANRKTGFIKDGQNTVFRCYSASQEALFPNVRRSRWNNLEALKGQSRENMTALINACLPDEKIVRLHVAGDFFSQDYFDAWLEVARLNPTKLFYTYTKSISFWVARIGNIPKNFKLNASFGGKYDELIKLYSLKSVKVVFSVLEAKRLHLKIDHDDSLAFTQDKSFALLLHGTQPGQSLASKALSALRALGIGGYSAK